MQARMSAPAERLSERLVLVVDDEEIVCRLTARVLMDTGFRVLEAHDGEEAAALLGALSMNAIGLVVSDISMPRMTGLELAALMLVHWPTVPVLLVSGQGGPPTNYAGPFLAKPFTPEALVAAAQMLLPDAEQSRQV
jgi:CheY-like chemotaxis protein